MTGTTPIDTIIQGDCLEEMKKLPDGCIDMILCDLPYGTTACKWDHVIPFEPLWKEYKRLIKDRGAIVLTASQPFTSFLVTSNIEMFKYSWIWSKTQGTNFMNSKNAPIKYHEDVLIFSKGTIANRSPDLMNSIQSKRKERITIRKIPQSEIDPPDSRIIHKLLVDIRPRLFTFRTMVKRRIPHKSPSLSSNISSRPTPTRAIWFWITV